MSLLSVFLFNEILMGSPTMADNLKIREPEDRTKINVNEAWELEYWTKEFKVSADKLRAAVKAVGPSVAKVKVHLGL